MPPTPASLLERLRDPAAEEAWARFVQLYTPLLFHWARGTGLQEPDAADLVQDVFALLVRKLPEFRYDPGRGFRAWLRTVTLNRWREIRRRAAPPQPVEGMEQVPDNNEPFWEADHRGYLARRLLALMQTEFAPATWTACWECAVEGRSAGDVGQELGMTPGAVRAAKFRVLCRLRQEMTGLAE